ncbi:hypothetical protein OBA41_02375 [Pelagibacteraceae bacterium]|nr:hypothetical protein [Pelagibacteraceae bacterium]|tara:strand:+ start:262 stop:465 length:204 start_codon:yes stop_codon:yes gene_type:complete
MSEWESQVKNLQNTLNEIKVEIKENREEIVELKEDLATGKGAIKTVLWLGGFVTLIWTTIKIITILR